MASGADIGLALDGDADRLIVADEKGQLVDGDQLMALIALGLRSRGASSRAEPWSRPSCPTSGSSGSSASRAEAPADQGRRPLRARGDAREAAAMSAASNRGTSSSRIMRLLATASSRGFRCLPRWSRRQTPASDASPTVRAASAAAEKRPLQRRRRAAGERTASASASPPPKRSSRARAASSSANRAPSR